MKIHYKFMLSILMMTFFAPLVMVAGANKRPNIILVMADDQGWGQTGYNGHSLLKTPNLDAMAEAGLRMDRFYAAAPVCSPTRASVLTGRSPSRTGVRDHGLNLCLQEKTLPQALQAVGYKTGLFGKWHLNGVRGHGVPILKDDPNHPGHYGFDEWLSVTNFFDIDPLMSRNGEFEDLKGDSSEVVVAEALKFISKEKDSSKPFLAVIWYGSPHSPFYAFDEDMKDFPALTGARNKHFGELVALDRSIGSLRKGLRDMGIEKDTIVWYCSDNGGLKTDPDSCGDLRGYKTNIYEGGIRVPAIIEWPGRISPSISSFPASTMDIFPTLVELLGLPKSSLLEVHDGESINDVLKGKTPKRKNPIPFLIKSKAALIDGDYKLVTSNIKSGFELYNLKDDFKEEKDLSKELPELFTKMKLAMEAFIESTKKSGQGADYAEGRVIQKSRSEFWKNMDEYKPYFETFSKRPEFKGWAKSLAKSKGKKK